MHGKHRFLTPATLIAAALSGTEVAEIRGLPSTAFVLCPPMLQIRASTLANSRKKAWKINGLVQTSPNTLSH
jgi:hypothetical protein